MVNMPQTRVRHAKLPWILAAAACFAAALIFYRASRSSSYEIVHPSRGPITEAIYGLGTVRASRVYSAKAGVMTRIRDVRVEEGQHVKQGASLLQTDDYWVKAPWDGVVTSLPVNAGENVMSGAVILTLSDPSQNYLLVSLEQQDALRVRPDQVALISFESLRGNKISSRVKGVYSKDEQQFNVKIDLDNLPSGILPGMTADVSIEVGKRDNATLVPLAAIHQGRLLLRQGHRFQKVSCKVGVSDGRYAEILSPELAPDTEIQVPKPLPGNP